MTTNLIDRISCFFGRHDWQVYNWNTGYFDRTRRRCRRCSTPVQSCELIVTRKMKYTRRKQRSNEVTHINNSLENQEGFPV